MNPTTTETNASSIVARLSFSAFSALLAADADASVERQLLSTDQLDSTILKVGHHGSRSSSSNEFLAAVNPEVALISVGAENSFGHPNTETLTRFQEKGIPVLRTDQGGDIRFNSNGEGYTIHRGLGFRLW
jgi:competence protein ComEC